jgi:hypothetical protein
MPYTIICRNCGAAAELPDGNPAGFCPACGSKLSSNDIPAPEREAPQPEYIAPQPEYIAPQLEHEAPQPEREAPQPEYEAPQPEYEAPQPEYIAPQPEYVAPQLEREAPPPRKKRFSRALAVAGAALAIAAAAVFAVPALAGNSYQKAEARFLASVLSQAPLGGKGIRADFSLEYEPGSGDIFGHMNALLLSGAFSSHGNSFLADFSLLSGGEKVTDCIVASGADVLTLSVPDLTRYALRLPVAGTAAPDYASLDEEALAEMLADMLREYFRLVKPAAETEKGVALDIAGASVKCDAYTISFTEKMIAELLVSAIGEMLENDNFMEFLQNAADRQNPGEIRFDELLREAEEEIREEATGDDVLFRMTVWVSGGDVAARRIDNISGSSAVLYYQALNSGAAKHFMFELGGDGFSTTFVYDLKNDGGAWSGTAELAASDAPYGDGSFEVRADIRGVKRSGDLVSGNIGVTGEMNDGGAASSAQLGITLGGDGGRQRVKIEGRASDGYYTYELGALTLTYAAEDIGGIIFPEPPGEELSVYADDSSESNARRASEMADDLSRAAEAYEDGGDFFIGGLLRALAYVPGVIGYDYGYDYGYDSDYDYGYDYGYDSDYDYGYDYGYDFA